MARPLGQAVFPSDAQLVLVEDFEDKSAGELNGQGGWIADSQDGVVVGPPAPGDTGG